MRTEKLKWTVPFLFFLFVGFLHPGLTQQNENQKSEEQKSLVMKELLKPRKKSLPPPKRNIFTRKRENFNAGELSPRGNFSSPGQISQKENSPEEKKAAEEEAQVNVKYIGYVRSGTKVVALIILEGQTYAVESGDVLEMGVTIGEITPDDLEVLERGTQPKRVKLEGERP